MLIGKNPLNKSPEWFTRNIEIEPENNSVEVDGASINFNVWGDKVFPALYCCMGSMLIVFGGHILLRHLWKNFV